MIMEVLKKYIKILRRGGIGVLPTDTIYGIVGSALNKKTIERIYKVRKRNLKKPFIILISSVKDLHKFGVNLDLKTKAICKTFWPGPVSVILPVSGKKFSYLHRGKSSLAFRLPKPRWLRNLIEKTGPLAAPSANPEGLKPASSIKEAKRYFGKTVDFYLRGRINKKPSTLVAIKNGKVIVKRI